MQNKFLNSQFSVGVALLVSIGTVVIGTVSLLHAVEILALLSLIHI